MMGLEPFIFTHEGLALSRSNGSTPWMMPIPSPYYNLDDFTHIRKDGPGAEYETKGIIETLDECELSVRASQRVPTACSSLTSPSSITIVVLPHTHTHTENQGLLPRLLSLESLLRAIGFHA